MPPDGGHPRQPVRLSQKTGAPRGLRCALRSFYPWLRCALRPSFYILYKERKTAAFGWSCRRWAFLSFLFFEGKICPLSGRGRACFERRRRALFGRAAACFRGETAPVLKRKARPFRTRRRGIHLVCMRPRFLFLCTRPL